MVAAGLVAVGLVVTGLAIAGFMEAGWWQQVWWHLFGSDIGQESLTPVSSRSFQLEPPNGPSPCAKQRKYTNHKLFVSEKQYPKRWFFSENF